MKTRLVRIRNSQGIRIPKLLLKEDGFGLEVELTLEGNATILRAPLRAREGWEEAFSQMASTGDDALIGSEVPTTFDEWRWP